MRFLAVVLALTSSFAASAQRPVWIDTDPSVAPGGHEIDDGLALVQAFGSRELAIRGVSIIFGNAELPTADRIGRDMVKHFGPGGLAVYTGAAGKRDLGRETDASRAIARVLKSERLTLLALGPATNVATVLKLHPELAGQIDEIVAVAGRRPGQRFTAGPLSQRPLRDFNFEMDPDAFQILLDSRVKLVFAPWEVSSKVWLTRAELEPLAASSPAVAWMMPAILDWLQLWKTSFGTDGFNPFDTLAIGYLTDRDTIECADMAMRIERGEDDTSTTQPPTEKPYLVVREQTHGRVVTYCHTPSPVFKQRLLRRLSRGSR